MKLLGSVTRAIAVAGILGASALPALAAQSDIDALSKYLGTYTGKGTVTGSQAQSVTCKMQLSSGNGGKLNYTGRCELGGAQLSVTGTIAYSDTNHRYEAVMNSGIGGFRGVAIGQKQGDRIVFDLHQRADDNEGNDITIASTVVLDDKGLSVDFHAVFNQSGDKVDAKIPFTKV
jgi:hypothetical protein